ncbi:DNA-binding protein [Methylobacterium sp. J-068]|uniref:DNA-binding protein n=1 Tax=Methylobacterium sp. J-068 TaxID=2836649 RepID=UPI001FB9120A|nr:DNA-binding protein [Methylobacterium sp. J-068]MCJ2035779.1 DNA-binding protein [Methylobacterium sp. J-068]
MLRRQARRSFTVEVKQGAPSGRSVIPAKQPRVPRGPKRVPEPPAEMSALFAPSPVSADTAKAEAPRRILPNLIAWEPPEPEAEPAMVREPPLPRVRRVVPAPLAEAAPRRRGRPRKVVPEAEAAPSAPPEVAPSAPQRPVFASVARAGAPGLPRAERWKRRLHRACW